MKILLINPPRWNELVGKNPAIIEKHRGFNPPLGLLHLASSIQKYTSNDVDVLDTQPTKLTYIQLEKYLKDKLYDIVGISVMTFTLIDSYHTAKLVKKVMPKAKVIMGGPHVHLYPLETINLDCVDFAFMGEADLSFIKFLQNLENGTNFQEILGLVYRNNNKEIVKNNFPLLNNLDEIPFPDRNLLNINRYNSLLSRGSLSTTIISSRGCPFKCAFCDRPLSPITSYFRYRSANNVVDEICECIELGIKDFLFYDDTFTVNKKRVFEICEEINKRHLNIRWDIRTRVDLVNEEMLKSLKKAGCQAIHYGVESGNDKILKAIKKGFTTKKAKETFYLTKKHKIDTLAYFMIGLPSETLSDIQNTFDLAKNINPDYAHFTIFSPYPRTELYYLGLEKGIIKKDLWKEFAQNPLIEFKIPIWEENFTREQLYKKIVALYKNFYLRPSYIIKRGLKIRSKNELLKKAKAGLSVFLMSKNKIDKLK